MVFQSKNPVTHKTHNTHIHYNIFKYTIRFFTPEKKEKKMNVNDFSLVSVNIANDISIVNKIQMRIRVNSWFVSLEKVKLDTMKLFVLGS